MRFGEKVKELLMEGLGRFGREVGAEFKRLAEHGAMEGGSALFQGHGYVPYGPGAYRQDVAGPDREQGAPEVEHQQEQGREM
jgi:hypothetical protein